MPVNTPPQDRNRSGWFIGVVVAVALAAATLLFTSALLDREPIITKAIADEIAERPFAEAERASRPARVSESREAPASRHRKARPTPYPEMPSGGGQVLILAYSEVDNKPINDLHVVVISRLNTGESFHRSGVTNEQGQVVVRHVPAGKYSVICRGYGAYPTGNDAQIGRAFGEVEVQDDRESVHYIIIPKNTLTLTAAAAIPEGQEGWNYELLFEMLKDNQLIALGRITLPREYESGIGGVDIENPIMIPAGIFEVPFLDPGKYTLSYYHEDAKGRVIGRKLTKTIDLTENTTLEPLKLSLQDLGYRIFSSVAK